MKKRIGLLVRLEYFIPIEENETTNEKEIEELKKVQVEYELNAKQEILKSLKEIEEVVEIRKLFVKITGLENK